jgi:hypothetical protein
MPIAMTIAPAAVGGVGTRLVQVSGDQRRARSSFTIMTSAAYPSSNAAGQRSIVKNSSSARNSLRD